MHIFSNCKVALAQGRYSWRHDSVLNCLEPTLRKYIKINNEKKEIKRPSKLINFVKAGVKGTSTPASTPSHLLCSANDWKCLVDYQDNSIIFPAEICITEQRPDIILWSSLGKRVILIELTCPSEENLLQAKARKSDRYAQLTQQIIANGWTTSLYLIEAGVRGCLSHSFRNCLLNVGIPKSQVGKICKKVQTVVSRCSYLIFKSHKNKTWTPTTIHS